MADFPELDIYAFGGNRSSGPIGLPSTQVASEQFGHHLEFVHVRTATRNPNNAVLSIKRSRAVLSNAVFGPTRTSANFQKLPMSNTIRSSQFALNQLGWHAFQQLCGSVLSECWGQTYREFGPGPDGGRDGSFCGSWENDPWAGNTFVVQCKHISGERRSLRKSDINGELPKIKRLAARGLADIYVLMTNATLSGQRAIELEAYIQCAGAKGAVIYDATWIEKKILESPRLRSLVPGLYGIGDFSQILDQRAYEQANAIIESLASDLSRFVSTDAYRTALDAFHRHRFVMLLGDPAAGKSTIAHALALSATDVDDARLVYAPDITYLRDHWNPSEPQVFVLDDVFGSTQFRPERAEAWNRHTTFLNAMLKNCQLICTSRDYIFRRASEELKVSGFPLLTQSQVIVDVDALTSREKAQILYNHVKLGDLSREMRKRLKPFLPHAATRPNFKPETARRLGTSAFAPRLQFTFEGIANFFDEPRDFLVDTVSEMGMLNKAALVLLFASGGWLPCPIAPGSYDAELAQRLALNLASIRTAFSHLQDSFVKIVSIETNRIWQFRHPTLHEAIGYLVRNDQELLDLYVTASPLKSILQEVSCGVPGIPGVEFIVPDDLFPQLVRRMTQEIRDIWFLGGSDWHDRRQRERIACNFLSGRCSARFLSMLLSENPEFVPQLVRAGPYLDSAPEPALVAAIAKCGLLDTKDRANYVKHLGDLAVEIPDPGWISVRAVRDFLTTDEKEEIRRRVKEELVPNLESIVYDLCSNEQDNAESSQDFQDGISMRIAELDEFAGAFQSDIEASTAFRDAAMELERMANETDFEFEFNRPQTISRSRDRSPTVSSVSGRNSLGHPSIFSDVDQ